MKLVLIGMLTLLLISQSSLTFASSVLKSDSEWILQHESNDPTLNSNLGIECHYEKQKTITQFDVYFNVNKNKIVGPIDQSIFTKIVADKLLSVGADLFASYLYFSHLPPTDVIPQEIADDLRPILDPSLPVLPNNCKYLKIRYGKSFMPYVFEKLDHRSKNFLFAYDIILSIAEDRGLQLFSNLDLTNLAFELIYQEPDLAKIKLLAEKIFNITAMDNLNYSHIFKIKGEKIYYVLNGHNYGDYRLLALDSRTIAIFHSPFKNVATFLAKCKFNICYVYGLIKLSKKVIKPDAIVINNFRYSIEENTGKITYFSSGHYRYPDETASLRINYNYTLNDGGKLRIITPRR